MNTMNQAQSAEGKWTMEEIAGYDNWKLASPPEDDIGDGDEPLRCSTCGAEFHEDDLHEYEGEMLCSDPDCIGEFIGEFAIEVETLTATVKHLDETVSSLKSQLAQAEHDRDQWRAHYERTA